MFYGMPEYLEGHRDGETLTYKTEAINATSFFVIGL